MENILQAILLNININTNQFEELHDLHLICNVGMGTRKGGGEGKNRVAVACP
jgi:hypothetical protein